MIRKAAVAACLLLALATIVVGVLSYRREIVCMGPKQGIAGRWDWPPIFDAQNDFLKLTKAPRTSFVKGAFLHLWASAGPTIPGNRTINGVVFRWRQTAQVSFRSNDNRIYLCVFSGILVNQIGIPLWGPLILFLLYPVLALIHGPLRRHRRRKRGLCLTCGYNLTGNVSGICPECGETIGCSTALQNQGSFR